MFHVYASSLKTRRRKKNVNSEKLLTKTKYLPLHTRMLPQWLTKSTSFLNLPFGITKQKLFTFRTVSRVFIYDSKAGFDFSIWRIALKPQASGEISHFDQFFFSTVPVPKIILPHIMIKRFVFCLQSIRFNQFFKSNSVKTLDKKKQKQKQQHQQNVK